MELAGGSDTITNGHPHIYENHIRLELWVSAIASCP